MLCCYQSFARAEWEDGPPPNPSLWGERDNDFGDNDRGEKTARDEGRATEQGWEFSKGFPFFFLIQNEAVWRKSLQVSASCPRDKLDSNPKQKKMDLFQILLQRFTNFRLNWLKANIQKRAKVLDYPSLSPTAKGGWQRFCMFECVSI